MSNLAAAKYGAEAAKMKLPEIPIFNGNLMSLMPDGNPDAKISILTPSLDNKGSVAAQVVQKFAGVRDSIFPYVMGVKRIKPSYDYDRNVVNHNEINTRNIVGRLLIPKHVSTGQLFDVSVEAITYQQVPEGLLSGLSPYYNGAVQGDWPRTVFLVVYGRITTVAFSSIKRAGLGFAYSNITNRKGTPSPAFVATPLGPESSLEMWNHREKGWQ